MPCAVELLRVRADARRNWFREPTGAFGMVRIPMLHSATSLATDSGGGIRRGSKYANTGSKIRHEKEAAACLGAGLPLKFDPNTVAAEAVEVLRRAVGRRTNLALQSKSQNKTN